MATSKVWGTVNGKVVDLVTLKSEALEVDISGLGATLVAVRVKVRDDWVDVVFGYESLERYTEGGAPYLGCVVGRCANRIKAGEFSIDGKKYTLEKNERPNHLHGGSEYYGSRVFTLEGMSSDGEVPSATFSLDDPDGHMGYPGNVHAKVTYEVRNNELHFRYEGTTDKATILNMTNHCYWNLKGHQAGDVLDHRLMINASRTVAVDDALIPTGNIFTVNNMAYDLRGEPKLLRQVVEAGGPIDVNFCIDEPEDPVDPEPVDPEPPCSCSLFGGIWSRGSPPAASRAKPAAARGETEAVLAARLVGPNGLFMDVWTDQPGLQVYSGHGIDSPGAPATWWHGKGAEWHKFGAIALESQLWPDAINNPAFASPILRPGETYKHHSWRVFTVSIGKEEQ